MRDDAFGFLMPCEDVMPQLNQSATPWTYASIMVSMDRDPTAESRVKLATSLADRFSSRLIGVAAYAIAVPLYFETSVEGIASSIQLQEQSAAQEMAKTEAMFRRAAGTRNRVEWRHTAGFPLDHVLEQARAADLIVAGRPRRDENRSDPMYINGGDLVMAAGRPLLFVPPQIDYLAAKHVVIGWKDSREARRAVLDSLPFLKAAKDVFVVSVDNNDWAAKDVATYLGCHGVTASAHSHAPSGGAVADTLIRVAGQEGADLIVCGAYGHSRTREWVFGGVTRDLLDHAGVCCLMAH
jgi:nucleotide-binding universal stress UspA family protein